MGSTSRTQPCPCSSCRFGTECMEFQKIVESKDGGLAIYRYVPESNDALQKRLSETSEAFILRNKKNVITQDDLTMAFEHNQITCPRCIKIVKHAESLVKHIQLVDGQHVFGVCDHCRLKEQLQAPSCRCKEVLKKFKTKEEREVQRQRVKKWLTQVQQLLKNALIDGSKGHESKKRARSELSLDKLFSEIKKSEPKYYKKKSRAGDILQTSAQRANMAKTSSSSERVEDAYYTDTKEYLKRDQHRGDKSKPSFINFPEDKQTRDISKPVFLKLPEDEQLAVSKLSEEKTKLKKITSFVEISEEYVEAKPKRKKFRILKIYEDDELKKQETNEMFRERSLKDNISKAVSEQDVSRIAKTQEFTLKSKNSLEDALLPAVEKRKTRSPQMPWVKSASEQDLSRDFSFLFLKEKIEIIKKRTSNISSAELIRDLQDTLKRKAEEEKNKKEDELRRNHEKKEQKILEKEEKNKIASAERKALAAKELFAAKEKQLLLEEKREITEKANEITTASSITMHKAEKEARGQHEIRKVNEMKSQKQKLDGQESSRKDKEDQKQNQKLEGQDKLKKVKDSSKQDKKGDNKEKNQAEKAKIVAQKLAEKEAQKTLKEQQKKEKEEQALKAKNEKLQEQEKIKREKAEKVKQKLEEKESLKKEKDDRLQKNSENADKSANKDNHRQDTAKKDETSKIYETIKEDETTKKDKTTKIDDTTKKDDTSKKYDTTKKHDTNKKDEITKKEETVKESSSDKKREDDRLQLAANDELKALLALQEKEEAEREKIRKQQELEKELAEKKSKEAEKMAKEDNSTKKHEKNKETKNTPKNHEEPPLKKPESPPPKDLAFKDVKVRKPSGDDLILRLVRLKQSEARGKESYRFSMMNLTPIVIKNHARHKCKDPKCPVCSDSELGLDYDECVIAEAEKHTPEEITDIIIGEKIYKNTTPFKKPQEKEKEPAVELIAETGVEIIKDDNLMQESPKETVPTKPLKGKIDLEIRALAERINPKKLKKNMLLTFLRCKYEVTRYEQFDPDATKGVIRYALSDRAFIDKGWTMLPTEKVVRKMNVYRMRPAHPEFDWFEHNKYKRLMQYDTGEKLAEFDDNGRGRWFYRSGKLALDYYDAEEINAQQRFVVYSSGEPDERGRTRPRTILATFDYLGNGIVFDHAGKIRLKYNQTEGVVLDRSIGPVSQWKWHTLNDPPVLQQVMIDTQMPYKDPTIMKLGGPGSAKKRVDNEEMLAIEFDNFIKEKSRKLTQKFKPFQIRMKALKINEYFSLRVLDQATVYLLYRDGTTNLKINMGMILDHKEIVDTDTADVGDVSNSMERLPARTDSLAVLQQAVAQAQREERSRVRHERRLHKPADPCASAEQLIAAASRPLQPPLITASSGTTLSSKGPCKLRKPPSNLYYDTRL